MRQASRKQSTWILIDETPFDARVTPAAPVAFSPRDSPSNPTYPTVLRAKSNVDSLSVHRLERQLSSSYLAPGIDEPRSGKSQKDQHDSDIQSGSTGQQVHGEYECKQSNQEQVQGETAPVFCLPNGLSFIYPMPFSGIGQLN